MRAGFPGNRRNQQRQSAEPLRSGQGRIQHGARTEGGAGEVNGLVDRCGVEYAQQIGGGALEAVVLGDCAPGGVAMLALVVGEQPATGSNGIDVEQLQAPRGSRARALLSNTPWA